MATAHHMKTYIVSAIIAVATLSAAQADDWPAYPLEVALRRADALEGMKVSCVLRDATRLHCLFGMAAIVVPPPEPPLTPEKRAETVARMLKQGPDEGCGRMRGLVDSLQSGRLSEQLSDSPEARRYMTASPKWKSMFIDAITPVLDFCNNPSEQTAAVLIDATTSHKPMCCDISIYVTEHDFTTSDNGKTWLSNEGPMGSCNVYVISRLDHVGGGAWEWKYSTRKVVTGKDASPDLPSCSLLDQQEHVYKKESDVMPPDADFINWSIR